MLVVHRRQDCKGGGTNGRGGEDGCPVGRGTFDEANER